MNKSRYFQFRLTDEEFRALADLSLAESIRLNQEFTRSDWLRRQIQRAAARKGFFRKSE